MRSSTTIQRHQAVPVRSRRRSQRRSKSMLDVILLAVGLGFFALSIAYAFACELL